MFKQLGIFIMVAFFVVGCGQREFVKKTIEYSNKTVSLAVCSEVGVDHRQLYLGEQKKLMADIETLDVRDNVDDAILKLKLLENISKRIIHNEEEIKQPLTGLAGVLSAELFLDCVHVRHDQLTFSVK